MDDESISRKKTLHKKRLVGKYSLLLSHWDNTAAEVFLSEIAEVLDCSPRHTRLLLQSMMALHWLTWDGRAGRGAKGRLHCRVRDIELQSEDFTTQVSFAPYHMESVEEPEVDSDERVCLNFYRSIDKVVPSDHTGRVERHLLRMVHAGLTRFDDRGDPVPDLAESIEIKNHFQEWAFHLRPNLYWHSGEPAVAEQILQSLRIHLAKPAFEHVVNSALSGDGAIMLTLARPDAMLAHRLANTVHSLSHPNGEETGLGPFIVHEHDHHHLRLRAFARYHGAIPAIKEIEYRIRPSLPRNKWTTISLFQSGEDWTDAEQTYRAESPSGLIFLAFNERKGTLDEGQQDFIRALARIAVGSMMQLDNTQEVPPEFRVDHELHTDRIVQLPAVLKLKYFWCSETEMLMKNLKRQLLYWGCNLDIKPVDANLWFSPISWEDYDIGVSDLRFGEKWYFAPAERFHHSVMIKNLMTEECWHRLQKLDWKLSESSEKYPANITRVIRKLAQLKMFLPLYSLKFQVKATKKIKGIRILSQGWPDFTRIWIEKE